MSIYFQIRPNTDSIRAQLGLMYSNAIVEGCATIQQSLTMMDAFYSPLNRQF